MAPSAWTPSPPSPPVSQIPRFPTSLLSQLNPPWALSWGQFTATKWFGRCSVGVGEEV